MPKKSLSPKSKNSVRLWNEAHAVVNEAKGWLRTHTSFFGALFEDRIQIGPVLENLFGLVARSGRLRLATISAVSSLRWPSFCPRRCDEIGDGFSGQRRLDGEEIFTPGLESSNVISVPESVTARLIFLMIWSFVSLKKTAALGSVSTWTFSQIRILAGS